MGHVRAQGVKAADGARQSARRPACARTGHVRVQGVNAADGARCSAPARRIIARVTCAHKALKLRTRRALRRAEPGLRAHKPRARAGRKARTMAHV
eukprot:5404822-Pleurochrysis_carterae.AAC.1